LGQLKKEIQANQLFWQKVNNDGPLQARFEKDGREYFRKKAEEKEKRKDLSKQMSLPKKQYKGCVATRLQPTDYEYCNDNYDDQNAHYERYGSIIPQDALRQKEYYKAMARNDVPAQNTLRLNPDVTIRELPRGIRLIMKENPEEFSDYLREIKAEREYLKAIQRNVNKNTKDVRAEKYEEIIRGIK
jgi:hypothetical protein